MQVSKTAHLVSSHVLIYSIAVRLLGNIFAVFMCLGLIFQVSAQAASLPQTEPMTLSDCSKMNHHASHGSKHIDQTANGQVAPCSDMSLKCMLSMNAVAPVLLGNDLPAFAQRLIPDVAQYTAMVTDQLLDRAVPPDYPPPRF